MPITVGSVETRYSICEQCREPIEISLVVGQQRWDDVDWIHDDVPRPAHRAVPEPRFAIDATCPGCGFPEMGFSPATEQFVCSTCQHTQTERPKD